MAHRAPGAGPQRARDRRLVRRARRHQLELAQATLAEAENRLREGEALAHIGGWAWDPETDTVQWSDELYRIHGVDPHEFEGSLAAHLAPVASGERAAVEVTMRRAASESVAFEAEYAILRPDGETRRLYARARPVPAQGARAAGLRGVCIDMTDRYRVEAALQLAVRRERAASEELRAADRLKDDFLSTVSHELRTPLTSIVGFAALLDSADDSIEPETRDELVHLIGKNAVEMHNMIEGLLDFTRLQAGRVDLRLAPLDLAGRVRSCIIGLAPVLSDHVVTVSVPEELEVLADPGGLDRILTNLLSNAAKFAPSGSVIEVGARSVDPGIPGDPGAAPDGGSTADVEMWVHDRGPGVPSEHRERIFERFVQLASSPTGRRGTGVGLAVVRQYVELHGGHVWCDGAPGDGATFRFTLRSA